MTSTIRLAISHRLRLLLIVSALIFASPACSSANPVNLDNTATATALPAVGSTPTLAAQEILDRSSEAMAGVPYWRSQGESALNSNIQERRFTQFTVDMNAPDSSRMIESGFVGSETYQKETIVIGSTAFARTNGAGWEEIPVPEGMQSPARGLPDDFIVDEPVQVVAYRDSVAYRLVGHIDVNDDDNSNELSNTYVVTLLIDPASFRMLHNEQTIEFRYLHETFENGRFVSSEPAETRWERWEDFSYPAESSIIEVPQEFAPLGGSAIYLGPNLPVSGSSSAEAVDGFDITGISIPTPFITVILDPDGLPTPSANWDFVPVPAFTVVPGAELTPFDYTRYPEYDRLMLPGDVVVLFRSCDPNSVADGPAMTLVHFPSSFRDEVCDRPPRF